MEGNGKGESPRFQWWSFSRDVWICMKFTKSVWFLIIVVIALSCIVLWLSEVGSKPVAKDLGLGDHLPLELKGEVPLQVSVILAADGPESTGHFARTGEAAKTAAHRLELRGRLPVQLNGSQGVVYKAATRRGFVDCLEMTGMATMTIGFGDIVPSSRLGKWISVFQGFLGMILLGLIVSVVSFAMSRQLKRISGLPR